MAKKLTCAFHGARGKAKNFLGYPYEIYAVSTPQKKIVGNACGLCARQLLWAIGIDPYAKNSAKGKERGATPALSHQMGPKFHQLVRPNELNEEELQSLETSFDEVDQKAAASIRTLSGLAKYLLVENAALRQAQI